MQTKKEEIREEILAEAQKEFLLHGYEGASMRVIAKKANTTLGNIYHYFPNKEAILSAILEEPLQGMHELVEGHLKKRQQVNSMDELQEALRKMEEQEEYQEMQYLMDVRLLILFDLKTTHFVEDRDYIIREFKKHMAWHMGTEDSDSAYVDILATMFISCIRHVLLEHKDKEKAMQEFVKVFKMLCSGLIVNSGKEGHTL